MIASGTCGTCSWEISDSGVLTIGAGTLKDNTGSPTNWEWYPYRTHITSIVISGAVYTGTRATGLFYGLKNATSLTGNLDTSNTHNMSYMFYGCSALTTLDLSSFDTSNVTDMSDMFYGCSALTTLDLSSFDTSNVIYMGYMFRMCMDLSSLNISSFNTSNVRYMEYMFASCHSLTTLNISSFNTSNVRSMWEMFNSCEKLVALDLSSFNTSNVTNMTSMFYGCIGLMELTIGNATTLLVSAWDSLINTGANYIINQTNIDITNIVYSSADVSTITTLAGIWRIDRQGNSFTIDSATPSGIDLDIELTYYTPTIPDTITVEKLGTTTSLSGWATTHETISATQSGTGATSGVLTAILTYTEDGTTYTMYALIQSNAYAEMYGMGYDTDDCAEFYIALDTTKSVGTSDGDIYSALTTLGWTSVIE